jgi:hypothetical protein
VARSVAEIAALAAIGCGSGSSSAPPAPSIAPDAVPILDAWATAVGGRDKLAKLGTVHRSGTIVRNGMAGRFEKWMTPQGARLDLVFDGFTEISVFDGTRGWFRDRAGDVRELEGIELDAERAATYWGGYAALIPGRQVGEVRANLDGTLRLVPRDCRRPLTIAFDPATHLPRTVRQPQHADTAMSSYDDYRDFDGVQLPFHEHVDVGDLYHADLVTLAIDHAVVDLKPPADRARPHLDAPIVVPYQPLLSGVPLISVTVEGKPMELIIATSSYSAIHVRHRESIAPNAPDGREIAHVTLAFGGLVLRDHVLDTRPFPNAERYFGRSVDGSLGYDVLSLFAVEIDPVAKTVTFRDRDAYRHTSAGVPITLEFGTPWVEASIEVPRKPPVTGAFALDTGCACDVMVRAPFTRDHDLLVGLDTARPLGGATEVVATITSLRIGGQRIDRPEAVFGMPHFGELEDPESSGIIGMHALGRYRVVFDYRTKRMWLDPPVSAASD